MEDESRRLQQLIFDLGRQSTLRDPVAMAAEAIEFTPPQLHAIIWLGRESSLSMGELAQLAGVTEKAITGIVDRLEHDNYVVRQRSDTDRRLVRVRLTSKGEETWRRLDAIFIAKTSTLLALLDIDDREALFRILEKLLIRFAGPQAVAPSGS